jgi:enoyl-CoA hydratase/carnithine racemase
MTRDLLASQTADGVAQLRLNRPQKRNAINLAMRNAIADALEAWGDDAEVRVAVVSGEGEDFAAGSDVSDLAAWTSADHDRLQTNRMWESLQRFPKPVIAAVAGRAWGGGCELAMACDIIVADNTASFAQPEIRLGITPGAGGVQRLFRLVGRSIGMRMVLTGEPLNADEALRCGLISELVDTEPLRHALSLASVIAAMPPLAVQAIKDLARTADMLPLDAGLKLERQTFLRLCDSDAKQRLMQAFLAKKR